MRSVVLACEHACAGAYPDRRRVAGHPSRTSAVTAGAKGRKKKGGVQAIEKRRGERKRETRGAVSVAGVEGTKE